MSTAEMGEESTGEEPGRQESGRGPAGRSEERDPPRRRPAGRRLLVEVLAELAVEGVQAAVSVWAPEWSDVA
ncbi:hypothetical protein [Streptomyces goshikiensis]|uniref:hypothetical protein n=1 Tax=Streptomyces goshikiensis TaxID=1942 RepID=UPI00366096AC